MDKNFLADLGEALLKKFCEANTFIKPPVLNLYRNEDDAMVKKIRAVGTCGYYRRGVIHVAVPACAHNNPNYSWPAFISDRTPYGVIQHELGHHIDEAMSNVDIYRTAPGNFFSDKINRASLEKPITSYCPNTQEWFAEIFRLFVTNPNLLQQIRPKAYSALRVYFTPVITMHSGDVLLTWKAPDKVFQRAENWINNRK